MNWPTAIWTLRSQPFCSILQVFSGTMSCWLLSVICYEPVFAMAKTSLLEVRFLLIDKQNDFDFMGLQWSFLPNPQVDHFAPSSAFSIPQQWTQAASEGHLRRAPCSSPVHPRSSQPSRMWRCAASIGHLSRYGDHITNHCELLGFLVNVNPQLMNLIKGGFIYHRVDKNQIMDRKRGSTSYIFVDYCEKPTALAHFRRWRMISTTAFYWWFTTSWTIATVKHRVTWSPHLTWPSPSRLLPLCCDHDCLGSRHRPDERPMRFHGRSLGHPFQERWLMTTPSAWVASDMAHSPYSW